MRTWRPYITGHAISRFLERVCGFKPIEVGEDGAGRSNAMLAQAGLTREEAIALMWPEHLRLDADPGGTFAMKRGPWRYVVRGGKLRTVLYGVWRATADGIQEANQIKAEEL